MFSETALWQNLPRPCPRGSNMKTRQQSKRSQSNDILSWDELHFDLDDILGEHTEYDDDPFEAQPSTSATRKSPKTEYKCPVCFKVLRSISGRILADIYQREILSRWLPSHRRRVVKTEKPQRRKRRRMNRRLDFVHLLLCHPPSTSMLFYWWIIRPNIINWATNTNLVRCRKNLNMAAGVNSEISVARSLGKSAP